MTAYIYLKKISKDILIIEDGKINYFNIRSLDSKINYSFYDCTSLFVPTLFFGTEYHKCWIRILCSLSEEQMFFKFIYSR